MGYVFLYTVFIPFDVFIEEDQMDEPVLEANQLRIRCDVCGRQDDTVRYVAYPYVFSFIVVTFQRAFSGCWCRVHRIQRWLAASLITTIFGWFGFPFGIIFTPVRLLQLARGGVQDRNANAQLLRAVGDEKLKERDTSGAIRCFEASILYVDDPDTREKLRNLYRTQPVFDVSPISGLIAFITFLAIPAMFAVLGMIIGLIDYFVGWISSSIFKEFTVYLLVLLQVPLVIAIYFSLILLMYLVVYLIRSARISSSVLFSVSVAVFSLAFLYAIVVGETFGIYTGYFINGFREPLEGALATLAAISTHAGFYVFSAESFSTNPTANIIYAVILSLSFVFALAVLLPKIRETVVQQDRLQSLRQYTDQPGSGYSIGGWAGVLGFLLVAFLFYFMVPQKSHVDTLEAYDHINRGYYDLTTNQPVLAASEYKTALELKPEFVLGHILLGNLYLSTGELDKARDSFETASKIDPNHPSVHSGFGWIYLQERDNESAKEEFRKTLQIDPQNIDGHLGLGWVYLYESNMAESKNEFQSVVNALPENPDAHMGLGILFFFENDYARALDAFDTTLKLNPNYVEAYFYKGRVLYNEDKYDDANDAYESALKLQPAHYGALNGLGEIQVSKYDFDEGVRYFDRAYEIDPDRVDAPLNTASILLLKGEFDQAADILSPYVQADSTIKPMLSYIQFRKGMNEEGERLLQESISTANELEGLEQGRSYLTIAGVYLYLNDFPKAKEYIGLAEAQPVGMDANSYMLLAMVLSAMGDFDGVEDTLQTINGMGHSEFSLHMVKAAVLIDQEKLEEAQKEVNISLGLDSGNSRAHMAASYILFLQGNLVRSRVEANRAIELNPYNSDAHAQLAFIYHALGRTDEALVEAQEAVRLDTLKNTSHYILGVCYMEKGMNAEAIVEFETFLDTYWDRAYVRDYKRKAEEFLAQLKPAP